MRTDTQNLQLLHIHVHAGTIYTCKNIYIYIHMYTHNIHSQETHILKKYSEFNGLELIPQTTEFCNHTAVSYRTCQLLPSPTCSKAGPRSFQFTMYLPISDIAYKQSPNSHMDYGCFYTMSMAFSGISTLQHVLTSSFVRINIFTV